MTPRPGLTAITFNHDGGGVAAVARLVRRVFEDEWGSECAVYELSPTAVPPSAIGRTAGRLRFGARVAAAEVTGQSDWLFHSHLAVARVQRFIPRRLSRPYAVFLHGIEVWTPLTLSERRLLAGAALVVTNSAHTARRAADANPGLPAIAVCPLGLATATAGRPSAAAADGVTVLTVARMASTERYKGHDQLLEALPRLRRRVADARLIFAGAGDDVARLKRKAHDLGVGDHVVFTGFLPEDELRRAYANASVFAMPSRGEGFGLTYLEAMAAGLPCVGSVHDAASEIIEDGVSGFLIDQSNTAALADRLALLLADSARRAEMGRRGRERFEREFTYEHFRRRFVRVIGGAFAVNVTAESLSSSVAG